MDVNYLHYRQQIETSRADAASSAVARKAHRELAIAYERRIDEAAGRQLDVPTPVNATLAVAMTAREVKNADS